MIELRFESSAMPDDTFQILKFDGEEELSHLFRFELQLVSRDPNIDFERVMDSHAHLAITTQGHTRYIHGMLSEFEQCGESQSGLYEYRAVLVPRLWMMTQSQQNQISQNKTVPDIIENELGEFSNKGGNPLVMAGLNVDDYRLVMLSKYEEREYVVQYKETDFNFISRLMEHEGIYYFFEHDENREKLIITDGITQEEHPAHKAALFQPNAEATRYEDHIINRFSRSRKQIPGSVLLKDYNYRSPGLPMQADSHVVHNGIGFVTEFGAHFKTPEEGEDLAAIRAEEYRCWQNIYTGESNIASFSCAGIYTLTQHFRDEYNQTYLITKVVHHGRQDIESWGTVGATSYHNQFSCIPDALPFRPQRVTPKPKLFGIMNGVIDSEQDLGRADIDEQGRYKVLMPFDISGAAPGKASRRIRMAQPYGGGGNGMSFPLVKGTEVIWTCIDGDIDRPIITGAVPNPLNPSVTTTTNYMSNVIKTTSGITMGFHDGRGSGSTNSSGGNNTLAAQQQRQNINLTFESAPVKQQQASEITAVSTAANNKKSTDNQSLNLQQSRTKNMEANLSGDMANAGADLWSGEGKRWMIQVPDYDETGGTDTSGSSHYDSYLRLGSASQLEKDTGGGWQTNGWLDYTDGEHLSVTQGKRKDVVKSGFYEFKLEGGTLLDSVNKGLDKARNKGVDLGNANNGFLTNITGEGTIAYSDKYRRTGSFGDKTKVSRRTIVDHTYTDKYAFGDQENIHVGFILNSFVSLTTEVKGTGNMSYTMGPDINFNGFKHSSSSTNMTSSSVGALNNSPVNEITGSVSTKINVKPPLGMDTYMTKAAAGSALVAAATGAYAAMSAVGAREGNDLDAGVAGSIIGIASAAHAALGAKAAVDYTAHVAAPAIAELSMTAVPPMARMGIGPGPISNPAMPGIQIMSNLITIGFGPTNQISISPAGITLVAPTINFTATGGVKITGGPSVAITGAKCDITAATSVDVKAPTLKTTVGMTTI